MASRSKKGRARQGTGHIGDWERNGRVMKLGFVELPRQNGKRRRKAFYGDTTAEVQAKINEYLRQREQSGPIRAGQTTLQQYCERWLARDTDERRPVTLDSYERKLAAYVYPALGDILLTQLLPAHFTELFAGMKARGLSERTVRYTRTIVRKILKDALYEELIARNPTDLARVPSFARARKTKKRTEIILPENFQQVVAAIKNDWLFPLFYLDLATGCRRGELCALHWSDVHLTGNRPYVYIQRSTQELPKAKGGIIHDDTKTQESTRTVHIPNAIAKALQTHRKAQEVMRQKFGANWNAEQLVFPNPKGGRLRPSTVSNHWRLIRDRAGAHKVRFHDLRHTHATMLLANGVSVKAVQTRLGHRNYWVTMTTYAQVIKAMEDEATNVAGELLPDTADGQA